MPLLAGGPTLRIKSGRYVTLLASLKCELRAPWTNVLHTQKFIMWVKMAGFESLGFPFLLFSVLVFLSVPNQLIYYSLPKRTNRSFFVNRDKDVSDIQLPNPENVIPPTPGWKPTPIMGGNKIYAETTREASPRSSRSQTLN